MYFRAGKRANRLCFLLDGDCDVRGVGARSAGYLQLYWYRVALGRSGRNREEYEVEAGVCRIENGSNSRGLHPADEHDRSGVGRIVGWFVACRTGAWHVVLQGAGRLAVHHLLSVLGAA